MKKIILAFIITLTMPLIAFAAEDGKYIYDELDHISEGGEAKLNSRADEIYSEYGISPYVCLPDCSNDDFINVVCELRSDVKDRIVIGVNEDYWYIYAGGTAEEIFTEAVQDDIWSKFNDGETWYDAAENFLEDVRERLEFAGQLKSSVTEDTQHIADSGAESQDADTKSLYTDEIVQCTDRLYDGAELLSGSERESLAALLDSLSKECGADIVVATVNSIGYYSPKQYADDYYDINGFAPDGVVLLVSMADRDWYISTTGKAWTAIDDDLGIKCISGMFLSDLSSGNYYGAFNKYAETCADFIKHFEETGKPYDRWTMPKLPMGFKWYLIAVGVGILIAFIIVSAMKAKLKSVAEKSQADDFVVSDSLKIRKRRETFLYSHVSRTAKPEKSSGSSGGGGGGGSHGGGGGKF